MSELSGINDINRMKMTNLKQKPINQQILRIFGGTSMNRNLKTAFPRQDFDQG